MMQLRTQNELSRRPLLTCKRDRSNFGTSGCSFSGLALLAFARFFLARSFNAAKAWLSKVCAVAESGPQSLRATAIDLNECDLSGAMQIGCVIKITQSRGIHVVMQSRCVKLVQELAFDRQVEVCNSTHAAV